MEINRWRYIEFVYCKDAVTTRKAMPTISKYFLTKMEKSKRQVK